MMDSIEKLLPGYNCGECGYRSCRDFSERLADVSDLDHCPIIGQERFKENASKIVELLGATSACFTGPDAIGENASKIVELLGEERTADDIRGVIDGLVADLALGPLPGEPVCREDLFAFDLSFNFEAGDLIRYRPLGCPVTHFARVISIDHGVLTVHMVGPLHLTTGQPHQYKDVGICMVMAFEGTVVRGRMPEVGKTVRFLPDHCMMQKVHSGVVVHSEGRMVRIEGIDLKVW